MRWIKRIALFFLAFAGILLIGAWLLLSSSLLAGPRGDLTARFLSGKLGQTVQINGGVSVELGEMLHVSAAGLVLPSRSMTDVTLAEIKQLDFDLSLRELRQGRVDLANLTGDGVRLSLLADEEGNTSWSTGPKAKSDGQSGSSGDMEGFFAGKTVVLRNSGVLYRDERNGLDLDLNLTELDLRRDDLASPFEISGSGALNGEELKLNGMFPPAQPFNLAADFERISLKVDGGPAEGGYGAGMSAGLALDISELGQLLDVLKLEKVLSGTGQVSARFSSSKGVSRIEDLSVQVNLDGGQSVEVTGELGELGNPADVTLDTKIRLYAPDNLPAPTKSRRNLKLTGVDMLLAAQPNGVPKRGMVIATNGFVLDTSGEGPPPIDVSQVSRTADGKLRLGKVTLRIGPPEAHFMVLEGSISDALRLEGIQAEAALSLPAASLFAPELFQTSDVLGVVSGGFRVSGSGTELALTDLNAETTGTDLWNLKVLGSVGNALNFGDVALNVAADVPSGADLLSALRLEPVATGPAKLTAKLSSEGKDWETEMTISVDQSNLGLTLDVDLDDPHPIIKGQIESDLIRIVHLRDIIAASIQFGKLNQKEKAKESVEPEDEIKVQPLVLSDPAPSEDAEPGPIRNVTLDPLGRAILLSGMDLDVGIDLRKVEGEKGTSSLSSELVMVDEKAKLGPLRFEYGGGHFDVSGAIDLAEHPDVLNLSGSTSGWDFGKIMHAIKFKKGANGILNANFDVTGSHASVGDFLSSMSGAATVSMNSGSIDTQLLDLAGLGVIPWLFSKDKGSAAPIVCLRAPLHVSNGRISTKQSVVETDEVQVVVFGYVDLRQKSLDVSGQPRKIGKPLSRSPWPFTAVGSLNKPKVKVKDGPSRLKRSDGASTMPARRKLCVPDILQLQ
ncbi:AsmA-like C-terminal region-containing protein [Primorskyibacter sp. S87]|uniref:AsmA family protein n=1 Tax=Primorskyibacter sp. S87 TaxID=3415126 RepID=UPI003C7D039C